MSIDDLMRPYAPDLYKTANISVAELRARYLALMVAAALHAVESAGLAPEVETEVARGLYDWARAHPDSHLQALLSTIEETTDAYAEAAADDAESQENQAGFSELELEFFDRLAALGDQAEQRIRACLRLSAVLPKHLWHVQHASALQSLRMAGLVHRQ